MSARHLSVEAAYDLWAATYDQGQNPMVHTAGLALSRLPEVEGLDVVEFGCGTGRNLAFLSDRGARTVTGFDLSAGMLDAARARPQALHVFQHDMTQTVPWPDDSADLCLIMLALEHLPELSSLHEVARILRPGGRLMIFEIHPGIAGGQAAAHFDHESGEVRMPAFAHRFSDYINALAGAGLHITGCTEWLPRDLGEDAPASAHKRGADTPLAIELQARLPMPAHRR